MKLISVFVSIRASIELGCFQENISGQSVHFLFLILTGEMLGHILSLLQQLQQKIRSRRCICSSSSAAY